MNHYETLGVAPAATSREIQQAYRKLALLHHPDRNLDDAGAADRFRLIAEAYAVVGDGEKRDAYDRSLGIGASQWAGANQSAYDAAYTSAQVANVDWAGVEDLFEQIMRAKVRADWNSSGSTRDEFINPRGFE